MKKKNKKKNDMPLCFSFILLKQKWRITTQLTLSHKRLPSLRAKLQVPDPVPDPFGSVKG